MQSFDIEMIVGIMSIFGAISSIFLFIGKLQSKVNKNSYDINHAREIIKKDVIEKLGRELESLDRELEVHASSLKNAQIRLYHLERWAENQGFSRVKTDTGME